MYYPLTTWFGEGVYNDKPGVHFCLTVNTLLSLTHPHSHVEKKDFDVSKSTRTLTRGLILYLRCFHHMLFTQHCHMLAAWYVIHHCLHGGCFVFSSVGSLFKCDNNASFKLLRLLRKNVLLACVLKRTLFIMDHAAFGWGNWSSYLIGSFYI